MQSQNDRLDDKRSNMDKEIKQKEYEIEMYKQDIAKQEKTIENIKTEWTNNIRNHEEEIKGYKQSYQILSEELSHTKKDLNEFLSKIASLKQNVNELSDSLENKNEENEQLSSDLNKFEKICNEQESKICQYSSELSALKNHYENLNNQNSHLNAKLAEMDNKYDQELKNSERLENTLKNLNEIIIELKFKVIKFL